MRDHPLLVGSLGVILAASGFGLLGPLARLAYDTGFEPLAFVAWRAAFGFLIIAAVMAVRARAGIRLVNPLSLPRADVLGLAIVSLAGLLLNVAMFIAFDLATVALVLLAFYTYPALVALVAVRLGHERLDATRLAALGSALGGMVLVVAGGLTVDGGAAGAVTIDPLGLALGLAAAVCQTVFVTVSRGRFATLPPEQAISWVMVFTALVCAAAAIVAGNALDAPLRGPAPLALAAVAGIAAAGIPSVLFLVGIRAIGPTRAGILMLFEPLVGVTLAALLLDEALAPIQVVGGGAILVAALLIQRGAGPGPRTEPIALPAPATTAGQVASHGEPLAVSATDRR